MMPPRRVSTPGSSIGASALATCSRSTESFSVSPPNTSYAKETPYAIVGINWILINATPSIWPRLDMHKLATPVLKEAVRKAISETLTA